jgi:phosphatidate cytidylyltransferase
MELEQRRSGERDDDAEHDAEHDAEQDPEGERPPSPPPRGPDTGDPGTSDLGTSDLGTSDPGTSDPGTSDPGTSDPGTSDLGTSDLGTSDPGTSDPGTSDPDTTGGGTSGPDENRPRKSGAGRNLPISIVVGLALGAMVLLSLYTGAKEIFLAMLVVFLAVGTWELTRAFGAGGVRVPLVPLGLGGLATLMFAYYSGPTALIGAFGLTVVAVLVWRMPQGPDGYVRDTTASVFIATYIPFIGGFAALLLAPPDGADRIVTFIAITVGSDIGGFFVGAFLGRHKLAPAISPKKTWEGFAGSALTCMVIGALLLPLLLGGHLWQGIVLGAAVVCSATLGDLIESMIKRDLGVKDMGSLLPEHGGVMDRLDSLLASVPIVWLALQIFIPPS